ncbi:MAG: molybdate ABC transporter permease subunit [Clostridia bacterium]|nr:molybdate ABC transporter permease subunit [Clostridia bacterium]
MHINDWFPIFLSLKIAALSLLFISLTGLPLARLLARSEFQGKVLLESLITLPLVLPPSVLGYGLLVLIGKNGPIGQLLAQFNLTLVFTWGAAVLASIVVAFPLMYQSAKAAFLSVNPNYEKSARTLGSSESKIFFTITLPLAWPGLMAGLVLSFARALGEFGATLMVAGNIPGKTQTIPLAIYFAVNSGDKATAQTLVIIITIFSFIVIYGVNRWSKGRK